jgi:hypothetical protein
LASPGKNVAVIDTLEAQGFRCVYHLFSVSVPVFVPVGWRGVSVPVSAVRDSEGPGAPAQCRHSIAQAAQCVATRPASV